eukprot:scaffold14984_cov69-Phaeocystis_antarctica.AAC.3
MPDRPALPHAATLYACDAAEKTAAARRTGEVRAVSGAPGSPRRSTASPRRGTSGTASVTASSPRATPRPRAETGFTRSHLVKLDARADAEPSSDSFPTTRLGEHKGDSYGLLSDPTLGGPSRSREMPAELVFFSWWNEELLLPDEVTPSGFGMGLRRQMELRFLTKEGVFQLVTDDARVPISFRVDHANGSPLQATELHVGARIDVLGRATTLQRGSAKTSNWIDSEAKRLLRRREALSDELAKFCDVQKALSKRGVGRLYLKHASKPEEKVPTPLGGETNLSRLHAEIHVLEALLKHHKN